MTSIAHRATGRCAVAAACVVLCAAARAGEPRHIDRLNQNFRAWLDSHSSSLIADARLAPLSAESSPQRRAEWVETALEALYPAFLGALNELDRDEAAAARQKLAPLCDSDNPFLAAYARYFDVRAAVVLGLCEEAEQLAAARFADWNVLAQHMQYAPHAAFLLAHCQAANLRFDAARQTLEQLRRDFADAPESVMVAARQLALEIERRETGTLGEAATIMDYSEQRLAVSDTGPRVREQQEEIVKLLDQLIQQAQQQEQKQGSGRGGGRGSQRGARPQQPQQGAEESRVAPGAGRVGDLHTSPKADPGEMWGKLPPAEREKVLQRLREKYPSRYRQLVEQYYRSLAEGKSN